MALVVLAAASPAYAGKVGKVAPPFTVTTFEGEKVSLDSLRGKVVILNYWATWCGPCRVELPTLDTYRRRHKTPDLVIFAIATEGSVPKAKLQPIAALLSFPLISKISGRGYGLIEDAVPTNYVIDRAGLIRYAKAAAFDMDDLEAVITPLLAEAPPATVAAAQPEAGGRDR